MNLPRQITLFALCVCITASWCAHAGAAGIKPFEAIVQAAPGEDVYARSGPGEKRFYPTLKLTNGQRVTVVRIDPGGWYMIEPPEGSFSWLPAQNVEANGQQGTVTENFSVVRVGAFQGNQRDVEQVRLNKGDTVEILDEQVLETEKAGKAVKEKWYRIKPPRGEFRWVKGSFLVELNPDGTPKVVGPKHQPAAKPTAEENSPTAKSHAPKSGDQAQDGDSHTAASPVPREDGNAPLVEHRPLKKPVEDESYPELGAGIGLGTRSPAIGQSTIRRELQAIDQKIKQIKELPESQWDFSAIEPELLALRQATQGTSTLPMIELRIRALQRDQLIQRNAVEMAIRDQRQPSFTSMLPNRPVDRNGVPLDPRSGVFRTQSPNAPNPSNAAGNVPGNDVNAPGSEGESVQFPQRAPQPSPGGSRFQGAGIVARVRNPAPQVPRYVLIKPTGQLLCYLDTDPGLNLEPYVGQSMGINGPRGFDGQLKADRMKVQKLTPVQLAP
jgi:hypothetical protein